MIKKFQIKNWEKYNPRSDVKSSSWYRQQNDFFNDPLFYKSSPVLRLTFIYILCAASKRMDSGIAKINTEMMADDMLAKVSEVEKSIQKLYEMGILHNVDGDEISTRSDAVVYPANPCATNERTDERTDVHEHVTVPAKSLPLEALFLDDEEIRRWCQRGASKVQQELLDKYDPKYLKETVKKAFLWQQENRKSKAGMFLRNWVEKDKEPVMIGGLSKHEYNMYTFFKESDCVPAGAK